MIHYTIPCYTTPYCAALYCNMNFGTCLFSGPAADFLGSEEAFGGARLGSHRPALSTGVQSNENANKG